jgi:ubiquinone/menaquinone biosynthesis C-methylase UbiE
VSSAFEDALEARNARDYADFLLPHLKRGWRVLDVGCGDATITLGLAERAGDIVGVDRDESDFAEARRYARQHGIENVELRVGDVYALHFVDADFDACLCHSVLEALERPLDALAEIERVLKPGGIVGVASVEYGGLILAGPGDDLLRRFYAVREQLWLLENAGDPYRGRRLRGLLQQAGFERVAATSKYFSYGTSDAVRTFAGARADECRDGWYADVAVKHGLATAADLDEMKRAWLAWEESPDAYLAFAWCRALGWKPSRSAPRPNERSATA